MSLKVQVPLFQNLSNLPLLGHGYNLHASKPVAASALGQVVTGVRSPSAEPLVHAALIDSGSQLARFLGLDASPIAQLHALAGNAPEDSPASLLKKCNTGPNHTLVVVKAIVPVSTLRLEPHEETGFHDIHHQNGDSFVSEVGKGAAAVFAQSFLTPNPMHKQATKQSLKDILQAHGFKELKSGKPMSNILVLHGPSSFAMPHPTALSGLQGLSNALAGLRGQAIPQGPMTILSSNLRDLPHMRSANSRDLGPLLAFLQMVPHMRNVGAVGPVPINASVTPTRGDGSPVSSAPMSGGNVVKVQQQQQQQLQVRQKPARPTFQLVGSNGNVAPQNSFGFNAAHVGVNGNLIPSGPMSPGATTMIHPSPTVHLLHMAPTAPMMSPVGMSQMYMGTAPGGVTPFMGTPGGGGKAPPSGVGGMAGGVSGAMPDAGVGGPRGGALGGTLKPTATSLQKLLDKVRQLTGSHRCETSCPTKQVSDQTNQLAEIISALLQKGHTQIPPNVMADLNKLHGRADGLVRVIQLNAPHGN